ncbi:MAG TPA: hypothetical protein VME46_19775 [Acidimicrobiales bacterium]|nr:hypothetical protein [Acidimicrobiales bacterium]
MTTALGARPQQHSSHARHSARRTDHRRRTAEKVLMALVLFVAFAVTVALLGLQWLGNQGTSTALPLTSHHPVSEVYSS